MYIFLLLYIFKCLFSAVWHQKMCGITCEIEDKIESCQLNFILLENTWLGEYISTLTVA